MKIKILKKIKITEIGHIVLPEGHVCEVSDAAAKVFIKKKFAEEVKEEKTSAKDVIDQINAVEKVEDLKQFESDDRKTVQEALKARTAELTKTKD